MSGNGVPPALDPELTLRALALALSQTLDDAGRAGFVVGLSGGLDSALAAAVAVRAVGPAAVHALWLPAPWTPGERERAAREGAAHLGVGLEALALEPLLAALPDPGDDRRRRELAARLRMALLYDRAAARAALVLGTLNKTEMALGTATLWGETAADCQPLGDLYRTQVVALARALGLPAAALEGTMAETDFDDGVADRVLYYVLEGRRRPEEIPAAVARPDEIERVLSCLRRRSFKRRPPHVVKLSTRTIGHDVHHPRAWRGPA